MTHKEWIESFTADTTNTIALKAGITPSTVYRQVQGNGLTIQNVVKIADTYGQNITAALVATGHIPPRAKSIPLLSEATLDQLLEEVKRRSQ